MFHGRLLARAFVAALSISLMLGTVSAATVDEASLRFTGAEFYRPNEGGKSKPVHGTLIFNGTAHAIQFSSDSAREFEVPYSQVRSILYERASKPRYAAGLLIAWPLLFTKSKQHFLTVQYGDKEKQKRFVLLRLNKSNYQEALAAAESQTGITVQRTEER